MRPFSISRLVDTPRTLTTFRRPFRTPSRQNLTEPPESLQRRRLHLAPPYLLDDYVPRYASLSATEASRKRSLAYAHLQNCNLCPRRCSVNRLERAGACLIPGTLTRVGTLAPHFGEEPCIQGHTGSGAIFFSGCNLRCVFCQNHDISHTSQGMELQPEELAEWMVKLQDVGQVHNINFVTPEHVVPQVVLAVLHARDIGLKVPIVYNTSAYDSPESIELLDGLIDIYLPDFKVWTTEQAKRLLKAGDYPETAKESIKKMWDQVGDLCFTPDGVARKGVLLRHLVMPDLEAEGREIMRWLAENVSKDLVVNVMEQYFPRAHVGKQNNRRRKEVTKQVASNAAHEVTEPGGVSASEEVKHREVRYADINRPIKDEEVNSVKEAAEKAGLWRFIEPARHGGFNL